MGDGVISALEQRGLRLDRGSRALVVLSGADQCDAFRSLCHQARRPLLDLDAPIPVEPLLAAWLARLPPLAVDAAWRTVSAATGLGRGELTARLQSRLPSARRAWTEEWAEDDGHRVAVWMVGLALDGMPPSLDGGPLPPLRLVPAVARLIDGAAPALLLTIHADQHRTGGPVCETAMQLGAALTELLPRVPVAVAGTHDQVQRFFDEAPDSAAKALARSGVLAWDDVERAAPDRTGRRPADDEHHRGAPAQHQADRYEATQHRPGQQQFSQRTGQQQYGEQHHPGQQHPGEQHHHSSQQHSGRTRSAGADRPMADVASARSVSQAGTEIRSVRAEREARAAARADRGEQGGANGQRTMVEVDATAAMPVAAMAGAGAAGAGATRSERDRVGSDRARVDTGRSEAGTALHEGAPPTRAVLAVGRSNGGGIERSGRWSPGGTTSTTTSGRHSDDGGSQPGTAAARTPARWSPDPRPSEEGDEAPGNGTTGGPAAESAPAGPTVNGAGQHGPSRREAVTELRAALEAEPRTRGRFVAGSSLEVRAGARRLTVELVCQRAALVVEVDDHRVVDAETHRRRQRRDLLLQLDGWVVLRVLAKDAVDDPAKVAGLVASAMTARLGRA